MSTLSSTIILKFCGLCQWCYEVWAIHKTFEDNLDVKVMKHFRCPYVLHDISIISQEYSLLQINKLHDPAVQHRIYNLTIPYVIKFGGWDNETKTELETLENKLLELQKQLMPARHKIIAHNDLDTILNDAPLGGYQKDKDIEYFNTLQKFVDIIHDKIVGGTYPLENAMVENDAKTLAHILMGKIKPLHEP